MDPRYNKIRYVGGTVRALEKRLKAHIYTSMCKNSKKYPVNFWILSLLTDGITPIIDTLWVCDTENYGGDEISLIAFCWDMECDLLNVSDGGSLGNRKTHSLISRKRISLSKKGKPSSNKGRKHTEQSRINMSLAHIGKRGSNTGNKHSEESKLKISISKKGKKLTQKHRDNISKSRSK